ncbi:uncharacterized protein TM35_000111130 [Trypanosoma theileri]|uniref:Uncharacterized protein n=1 Tax=Trypanosoma theileri TaxID=67003 RepID=A0A1X0NZF8_9TRYP|nr:uncharacterized protein TM35_000111130 [Trypanosoma theileri]ORC89579.1 hypothetical protein TM35_000111130 [Trypanosoma theileri]
MEPKTQQQLERTIRETVADADSPLAQRHIREMLKKNKFSSALMLLALLTPSAFLFSFYYSKSSSIREKWRDPYELPPGFDPNKGLSSFDNLPKERMELPPALVLKGSPGRYGE